MKTQWHNHGMKNKMYPEPFWTDLKTTILKAKESSEGPHLAAFDADGTLWAEDVGEFFFEYQIQSNQLDLPPNPKSYYSCLKAQGKASAFLWLAKINAGQREDQVRDWAEEAFLSFKNFSYFKAQKELVHFLKLQGFEVYIVTASIKWAVEPAARRYDIDEKHVLGVRTRIKNGKITDEPEGVVTFGEGKPKELLSQTGGVPPLLASGNTLADIPLLESATALQLAVRSQKEGQKLFATEEALFQESQKRGWRTFQF